jgi:hypothetical protein
MLGTAAGWRAYGRGTVSLERHLDKRDTLGLLHGALHVKLLAFDLLVIEGLHGLLGTLVCVVLDEAIALALLLASFLLDGAHSQANDGAI